MSMLLSVPGIFGAAANTAVAAKQMAQGQQNATQAFISSLSEEMLLGLLAVGIMFIGLWSLSNNSGATDVVVSAAKASAASE
jgi:hypothetical protein